MTSVWVPDPAHEAIRDLVRARGGGARVGRRATTLRLSARHAVIITGRPDPMHRRCSPDCRSNTQSLYRAEDSSRPSGGDARRDHLNSTSARFRDWSLEGAQALVASRCGRGDAVAELGDITRFANPRQKVHAYLVSSFGAFQRKHATPGRNHQGGQCAARRMLSRRHELPVSSTYRPTPSRQEKVSKPTRHSLRPRSDSPSISKLAHAGN